MIFNSVEFLIFFPMVTLLYFLFPHRGRILFLLAASCYFYMFFIPKYILILFALIVIDYFAGIYIENAQGSKRKTFLILSLIANVGILVFFKYFTGMVKGIFPQIILPIGLSFHTFQSMSYTIEVYRGRQKAEKNFFIYALYVMFYPQLVAGPIERPYNLLHQFHEKHKFNYQDVTYGLKLMTWGMFKKVVIADRAAYIVNPIYYSPHDYTGWSLIIATVLFAFQIYCDFSGYSDIAIGAARVMGFKLMKNFDRPYVADSIREFWRRWHISLSTWFRDYVYIPLGGSRGTKWVFVMSVMVTFLLSGIWHGSSVGGGHGVTFMIWGVLHGFYLLFGSFTKNIRAKFVQLIGLDRMVYLHKGLRIFMTFGLVCFAWIFFRAQSRHDAYYIVTHLFVGLDKIFSPHGFQRVYEEINLHQLSSGLLLFLAIFCLGVTHVIERKEDIIDFISRQSLKIRWSVYYGCVSWILLFGVFEKIKFLYFQF
ncbi:MAG: MBOAT family protein [Candidatus Omnitrophica bacterium]|nr:MBOAT family protein [Candidatus Omnitrophota bacterium]